MQSIGKRIYDGRTRRTSNLSVEQTCIGCGLCAKKCPVHAIEMQHKHLVWVKDRCVMCLGCLHRCPTFAIQCGPNTKRHGQYLHP
ncbi:4Fe-4S dicluster domain-containing protein [Senegalimassilia faecalis]|uniref:4Fe-4S dicluster domain-containing protein n=1 Tax=Senegalimassilia faecalis TaxID=2509433 RepID=A0A4Q2JX08_9ACTN|nr:4Fe-4S dicluster domain-containing protein [Senegalimassilia faecalis]